MMPESLLDELEQTAKDAGVRAALAIAFNHGKLEAYQEAMLDIAKRTVDSSGAGPEVDAAIQKYAASKPKFTPLAYNADWVEREGD